MMDTQSIVVGLVILAAFVYAGSIFLRKTRAFSLSKAACADDCGCSAEAKPPKAAN